MKAIILVAGYATRLYPLTLNKPKALLDVAGKTVLDYIVDEIETIKEIDEVIIVSNHKFYEHFKEWKNKRKTIIEKINIINDGTLSDEEKLGAIGDIALTLNMRKINDDVLVIAGDNLPDFKLYDFYKYFQQVKKDCILVKRMEQTDELKRMGIVLLDKDNRVLDFEEKPQNPKSNIAVFAAYIYRKDTLPLFETYLEEGNNPDAPGHFPAWLYKRKDVYAFPFEGECYDIGTHESYREVQEIFKNR